jgi:cellulose synthase/poly-beta-1,6-N-acetylglucosamine synthase-like glycosyltransferase
MDRRVVVLILAHNEAASISSTIQSVTAQKLAADQVLVIADNCTDRTAAVAAEHGAHVFVTHDNTGKKAGALNQALAEFLPGLDDNDLVLVMDGDSRIAPDFLAIASTELSKPEVGAVGGIFYGKRDRGGLIEQLQIAEYVRYARQVARNGSRAYVLTGTATAFTVKVLREVAAGREDGRLPKGPGKYYDERTMTEDSYMTFAVKTLGYQTPSPAECWVSTDVMPTWRMLWRQRRRWQLGALENLKTFGPWTRVTWTYTARQLVSMAELIFFVAFATTAIWSGVAGTYRILPFWIAIGAIFWLERIVSVRKAGLKATLIASVTLIDLGYGCFLKAVNIYSYAQVLRSREISWS